MSFAFMAVGYIFLAFSLFALIRKRWILGTLITFYSLMSMVVYDICVLYDLQNQDFVANYTHFTALPFSGVGEFASEVRLAILCLSGSAFIAGVGGRERPLSAAMAFRSEIEKAKSRIASSNVNIFVFSLLFLVILNIVHFLSLDLNSLWHNSSYLTIKNADEIGINNPLMAIYHQLFRVMTILTILGYFLFDWRSMPYAKVLCLIYSAYGLILMIAGSSRWSALYGMFAFLALQAFNKLNLRNGAFTLFSIFVLFEHALYSRSLNEFGVSQIVPNLLALDGNFILKSIGGVFVNTFEGGINFANGMILAPQYSLTEQLLSISPLPNAIDGYAAESAIMINPYAPMGGLGEFVFFNFGIQIFIIGMFLLFLRLCYMADRDGNVFIRYTSAMAGSYAIYILPSYSLRTSWKIIILVTAFLVVWYLFARALSNEQTKEGNRHASFADSSII
jgi:hypothetical protein